MLHITSGYCVHVAVMIAKNVWSLLIYNVKIVIMNAVHYVCIYSIKICTI